MKKVFAVSILAILATGAANAEIASKGYVDEKVTDMATQTWVGTQGFQTKAAMNTQTLVGTSTTTYASEKTVADAIAAAVNGVNGDLAGLQEDVDALTEIVGDDESGLLADVAELQSTIETKADASDLDNYQTKANMKLDAVGGEGQYIKIVSQTDGKVSATASTLATDVANAGFAKSADVTSAIEAAIKDVTDGDLSELQSDVADLKSNKADKTELDAYVKGVDMTLASTGGEGKYIKTVAQANGKVTATEGTLKTDVKAAGFAETSELNSAIAGLADEYLTQEDAAETYVTQESATVSDSGNYVETANTVGENLDALDAGVKAAKDVADAAQVKANAAIPNVSTMGEDGVYTLTATVAGDTATYKWELISRGSAEKK